MFPPTYNLIWNCRVAWHMLKTFFGYSTSLESHCGVLVFYFDDFFLFQSGSNSTSTGSSGSVSGGKKPFFLHPPNEAQGEQPQLTGNGKSNVCGQQLPPDISSGHKILAGADRANQGNLLMGIDNWSGRTVFTNIVKEYCLEKIKYKKPLQF